MVISAEALERARKRKAEQATTQGLAASEAAVPDKKPEKQQKSDGSTATSTPEQSGNSASSAQHQSQQQAAPQSTQQAAAVPNLVPSSAPAYILDDEQSKAVLTFNLKNIKSLAMALSIDTAGKTAAEMKCKVLRFCGASDAATFDPSSSTFVFPNLAKQSFAQPAARTPQ
jgi:hypothetical protein